MQLICLKEEHEQIEYTVIIPSHSKASLTLHAVLIDSSLKESATSTTKLRIQSTGDEARVANWTWHSTRQFSEPTGTIQIRPVLLHATHRLPGQSGALSSHEQKKIKENNPNPQSGRYERHFQFSCQEKNCQFPARGSWASFRATQFVGIQSAIV